MAAYPLTRNRAQSLSRSLIDPGVDGVLSALSETTLVGLEYALAPHHGHDLETGEDAVCLTTSPTEAESQVP